MPAFSAKLPPMGRCVALLWAVNVGKRQLIGSPATARNYRTVLKLAEMLAA